MATAYPEDIECIVQPVGERGGLFIGNLEAAQSVTTLKRNSSADD